MWTEVRTALQRLHPWSVAVTWRISGSVDCNPPAPVTPRPRFFLALCGAGLLHDSELLDHHDAPPSAACKMEAEWHLRPYSAAEKPSGAQRKKGESESDDVKYKLNKVSGVWTTGLCVEPTLEAHERYSEFISEIKGKYEQEDV
mmetsp:Transcript_18702/g.60448  ORF Transcript_18702/g.60448 Transcript_18702/m.60448 type:complete len:144 (-) Transcript_18702:118-549(-)